MHIHNKVNQLIEFVKEKTIESEKKGINNALSSQNYFVSWINTPTPLPHSLAPHLGKFAKILVL